ncbi:MAG TPA: site-2 protease family protein [Chthoniobacterales bacterium]|jgi:membrane-associated protease RseP (regulator of RpoE activity)|nr:site-2 protease family protein [Chthoniobacterales bacterium]
MQRPRNPLLAFLLMVALLLPWLMFLFRPGGIRTGHVLFWFTLLFCLLLLWMMSASQRRLAAAVGPDLSPRMLNEAEQPEIVRQMMDVKIAIRENGVQLFRGPLRDSASATFEKLNRGLGKSFVPLVQEDEQLGAKIVLIPKRAEEDVARKPVRPWLHWLLFGLTIVTTTWAGAAEQGVDLAQEPGRFTVGLPYSIGLLLILGVHELGHFFTARRYAMDVTPPYFIPVPFALGTFGAFIQMRSPPANRKALFDVAVAGPLAGLVIAVPALLLGLRSSSITAAGDGTLSLGFLHGATVGSSILFTVLTKLSFGDAAQYGALVHLSPLAFAGWLGLFITALNLLPVGQLDGGHITRAMFGSRVGQTISSVAMWSLFLLALFVWPGLMMWALIVFLIAGRGAPPLNDLTPLDAGRMVVGYIAIIILILILAPMPHSLWDISNDVCPYL